MIKILDKRDNTAGKVSEDYEIEYAGQKCSLKELQLMGLKIKGVIIQEDGTIDLSYKEVD